MAMMADVNKQASNAFWLARLQMEIPAEPKIRDVCANCNNVILSGLDEYICRLFDSTFVHIPGRNDLVTFEYDYHLLKRWLLKVSFNSARIHNSNDLHALEALRPYMLGEGNSPGKSAQLFLQLSYPEEIPDEDLNLETNPERPFIFRPTMNRIGHMFFRMPGVGEKLLRTVHLRSFTFYLAFFRPGERSVVRDDFADVFTKNFGAVLLRPSRQKIELLCDGGGAWALFKGSRTNQLIFDDGI